MDYRNERRWMYKRVNPGRKGLRDEFKAGVDNFVDFACVQPTFVENNVIKCPCTKCRNRRYKNPGDVKLHLYKWGFESNYWCWIYHGEEVLQSSVNFDDTSHNHVDGDDMYETMIYDNFGLNQEPSYLNRDIEGPHDSAKQFYELLDSAQQPLWSGCTADTELSFTLKMMSIKSSYNIAQKAMDEIFDACNRAMPSPNKVPSSFYEAEKLVSKLGLGHEKIDCCVNGCMLYYKEDIALAQCKFCFEPRFKKSNKPNSKVPRKRMHYLPLIPRLQWLFASPSSAKHMRWHFENQREPGVMCHPSDGEAWKHFDQMYPQFASKPRNVRLGICSDGFSPFGMSAKSYSCWPIIVTVYNLPPSMCMTTPYMFLTSIIPGVVTYDVSLKHNFVLKAALMWTISDFPAYGMLSGWQTAGKLSCPYQMVRINREIQNGNISRIITYPPAVINAQNRYQPRDPSSSTSCPSQNAPTSSDDSTTLVTPSTPPLSPLVNQEPKMEIIPGGIFGFIPCKANRFVMPCITKKFDEPIRSYTRASPGLKKAWLSLFNEKYYWRPEYHSRITKNFNKKGSEGLSRALSSARKTKQCPEWIILPIWVQLLEQWRDAKFISKCNTNKKNRNSDVGMALHTGGSIPITEYCRRYEEKHNQTAPPEIVYLQTHTKADGTFVTPKAKKIYDSYEELKSKEPNAKSQDLLLKAAGGRKKGGKVTGFASASVYFFPSASTSQKFKNNHTRTNYFNNVWKRLRSPIVFF
ncbi:unnamed protein product [Cuscuta epithymum]|uniref:Transposase-associated domain-containing protein n=1 Tax=Cuscuta epithymum TaxID=186058 RepID=A0AAV0EP84_9ASTE|nr:unnamed protein product [Cuscuta epithymum]